MRLPLTVCGGYRRYCTERAQREAATPLAPSGIRSSLVLVSELDARVVSGCPGPCLGGIASDRAADCIAEASRWRPVVCGDIVRRLVARTVAQKITLEVSEAIFPFQVCDGFEGGKRQCCTCNRVSHRHGQPCNSLVHRRDLCLRLDFSGCHAGPVWPNLLSLQSGRMWGQPCDSPGRGGANKEMPSCPCCALWDSVERCRRCKILFCVRTP